MGYYTYFTLEVDGGPDEQRCPTCGAVREWNWEEMISKFIGKQYNCEEYNCFEDSCKWYHYNDHMTEFSKLYPEYTFILEGNGEEANDRWRAYYKNGKTHTDDMIMRFPDFDPSTLE